MNELVTVVIPTYGGGQYLERAVDSVLHQTYSNIELIVVDDNGFGTSKQKSTAQVMSKYKGNPRVKYICHDVNKNGSAARNTGVQNSSGDFIALLDDDDEYLPGKIEKQVADLKKLDESYALVYCSHKAFDANGYSKIKQKTKSGSLFYELMIHDVVIGSDSLLIRRSVWEELNGFDETFLRHQDFEFTARVAFYYKVYAEAFVGFHRYVLNRNTPQNLDIAIAYRKHYLEKMKPYYNQLPVEKQRIVILKNMSGLCFQYLKQGKVVKFFKTYKSLHLGMDGIKYIWERAINRL